MYNKVNTSMNFVDRERETLKFWNENGIFKQQLEESLGRPGYTFYDGPPTANGKPHIGHVLTRVIKDLIPRYRWMKGRDVPRKAGWDTHGLPVEREVEKKLGLKNGRRGIVEYGLEPFINQCKESVWTYKGMWEDFSGTVGYWCDMEHPYVTYDNDYIESVWWALKEIWNKGLFYKNFKIVPYCPYCGTPLSAQEVAQGYKTVKERSAVVRFRAKGEDAYFLAWTTTPWTLLSNVALCVNPDETYAKVKAADGYTYYMAKALLDTVLGKLKTEDAPAYEILCEMPGSALEYREYEPLWACTAECAAKQGKKGHFVTCDGYVTMGDGTGIVHIAPAFGEDDFQVGKRYDLPFVQFVDKEGKMSAETPYAGVSVKTADPGIRTADPLILEDLKKDGKLFDAPKYEHDYPFCYRCDTPLIYYAWDTWFIKMSAVRDSLIRNNNTVNWIPASIGKGRFGDWLENVQDWAISRNRFWGTPLNIWECGSCGCRHCVGSIAELKSMSKNCPEDIELHRPYIDGVTLTCPECGGEMKRVPEVIDCWFDSGSMPFAQHHYPFENEDKFKAQFPADFISEAVDQTRGWFYSLMAISTLLFDCAPYRNVIVLGHVQDENGQKMSKSKGNAVDPFDALSTYGADAIRWYFYTNSAPWLPSRFSGKAVQEGQRKFLGTLWNTYAFYVLYADIDSFDPTKYRLEDCALTVMDRYALSVVNTAVKTVDAHLENYRIPEAAKALYECVDELSNWYVRRCRERYWGTDMTEDKTAAYMTLWTALVTVAKIAAPFVPFMADDIYRNLVCSVDRSAPASVHLCAWPVCDESRIDTGLEASMKTVMDVVVLGRAARNGAGLKNRQPLSALYAGGVEDPGDTYSAIIRDELNVKTVEFVDDMSALSSYSFKPNLKTVGPKYGKLLGQIRSILQAEDYDGNAAMAELKSTGRIHLELNGGAADLGEEDLLIEVKQKPGTFTVSENGVSVALNTVLTEELIAEGFVREVISKVQTMRKEADFVVTDHIRVSVTGSEKLEKLLTADPDELKSATLCDELTFAPLADDSAYAKEWDINGETAVVAVAKV